MLLLFMKPRHEYNYSNINIWKRKKPAKSADKKKWFLLYILQKFNLFYFYPIYLVLCYFKFLKTIHYLNCRKTISIKNEFIPYIFDNIALKPVLSF